MNNLSTIERFWAKVDRRDDMDACWPWTAGKRYGGYGQFRIGSLRDGSRRHIAAHRFVYELNYGPIPAGLNILHTCDNPPCCNPRHLFVGTQKDNLADMDSKNRRTHGSDHPNSKLTDKEVRLIRKKSSYKTQIALANEFSVSRSLIQHIIHRRQWRWLK